jgi:hypothetical protein
MEGHRRDLVYRPLERTLMHPGIRRGRDLGRHRRTLQDRPQDLDPVGGILRVKIVDPGVNTEA